MKSIEERLKKAALGAGCLFLALGAFEMPSHAADAASQVQSRALLVTRGDYEGTEYDLTPGPQNDGVNVSRMLQNAYGGQNISITTEEKTKTKSELKKAIQTAFADSDADDVNYFYYSGHGQQAVTAARWVRRPGALGCRVFLKTQSAGMRQQKLLSISLRKVLHRQKKKIRDFRVGRC